MKKGYFHLVLHGHVPYVLNHGTWPHGEVWLEETTWETYIPLLELISEIKNLNYPLKITINLTPILLEQISSPKFLKKLEGYIEDQIRYACKEEKEYRSKDPIRSSLAKHWINLYNRRMSFLNSIGGDLVGAFRSFAEDGFIEVLSCSATHGYLPLLRFDECVETQVKVGLSVSNRHFKGIKIKGFWLPECAYRASYEWTPPLGGEPYLRKGLEMILNENGISFSYTDHHLLTGQKKVGSLEYPYGNRVWGEREEIAEDQDHIREVVSLKPYYCVSPGKENGIIFFIRDPIGTSRVWSRDMGFPGNGRYLEFHKRAFPGGHRFWRVTDRKLGLDAKEYYDPDKAMEAVREHAKTFVNMLEERTEKICSKFNFTPLFAEVFDAELFGHWWHEGIHWLKEVFSLIGSSSLITSALGRDLLKAYERIDITHLWEGSWGAGGDHRIWFNNETKWMWEKIYECEDKMVHELSMMEPKNELHYAILKQAGIELLLLESSDWEFLYTTWQARDYAEQRFERHYRLFIKAYELAKSIDSGLTPSSQDLREIECIIQDDNVFQEVDHRLWRPKPR